jgi:hypothetical protein
MKKRGERYTLIRGSDKKGCNAVGLLAYKGARRWSVAVRACALVRAQRAAGPAQIYVKGLETEPMTPNTRAGGDAETKGVEGDEENSDQSGEAATEDETEATDGERAGGDAETKGIS